MAWSFKVDVHERWDRQYDVIWVKVIHTSERDKLSVKQIMEMFNIGNTQVYEILKKKTEILMRWENCANGKIKRELKKTANEDVILSISWMVEEFSQKTSDSF